MATGVLPPALRRPAFRRLTVAWTFSNFGDSAAVDYRILVAVMAGTILTCAIVLLARRLPVESTESVPETA